MDPQRSRSNVVTGKIIPEELKFIGLYKTFQEGLAQQGIEQPDSVLSEKHCVANIRIINRQAHIVFHFRENELDATVRLELVGLNTRQLSYVEDLMGWLMPINPETLASEFESGSLTPPKRNPIFDKTSQLFDKVYTSDAPALVRLAISEAYRAIVAEEEGDLIEGAFALAFSAATLVRAKHQELIEPAFSLVLDRLLEISNRNVKAARGDSYFEGILKVDEEEDDSLFDWEVRNTSSMVLVPLVEAAIDCSNFELLDRILAFHERLELVLPEDERLYEFSETGIIYREVDYTRAFVTLLNAGRTELAQELCQRVMGLASRTRALTSFLEDLDSTVPEDGIVWAVKQAKSLLVRLDQAIAQEPDSDLIEVASELAVSLAKLLGLRKQSEALDELLSHTLESQGLGQIVGIGLATKIACLSDKSEEEIAKLLKETFDFLSGSEAEQDDFLLLQLTESLAVRVGPLQFPYLRIFVDLLEGNRAWQLAQLIETLIGLSNSPVHDPRIGERIDQIIGNGLAVLEEKGIYEDLDPIVSCHHALKLVLALAPTDRKLEFASVIVERVRRYRTGLKVDLPQEQDPDQNSTVVDLACTLMDEGMLDLAWDLWDSIDSDSDELVDYYLEFGSACARSTELVDIAPDFFRLAQSELIVGPDTNTLVNTIQQAFERTGRDDSEAESKLADNTGADSTETTGSQADTPELGLTEPTLYRIEKLLDLANVAKESGSKQIGSEAVRLSVKCADLAGTSQAHRLVVESIWGFGLDGLEYDGEQVPKLQG